MTDGTADKKTSVAARYVISVVLFVIGILLWAIGGTIPVIIGVVFVVGGAGMLVNAGRARQASEQSR